MFKKASIALLLVLAAVSFSGMSEAAYPESTVNMLIGYAPGGGTDVSARNLKPFVEKYLNGSVAIVNKPGGSGEIAFTTVAKAKPDGYTIGMINIPVIFINALTRKVGYSLDDFEVIAPAGGSEHCIGVSTDSKIQNLEDLISMAKETPGVITIGSSGYLSDDYVGALLFMKETGIELNHVPFKGAGPARTAVLGNHVNLIAFNVDEAIPFVESGQIRLLGIMADERHEKLPNVPTFKEQGYNILSGSTRAIVAPKGTDPKTLGTLRDAFKKALSDKEYLKIVKNLGQTFTYVAPDKYAASLVQENENVKELLMQAGVIQ